MDGDRKRRSRTGNIGGKGAARAQHQKFQAGRYEIVAKSDVELEALAANVTDFASQVAEVRIARLHGTAA
jgi:hypothetical protein